MLFNLLSSERSDEGGARTAKVEYQNKIQKKFFKIIFYEFN